MRPRTLGAWARLLVVCAVLAPGCGFRKEEPPTEVPPVTQDPKLGETDLRDEIPTEHLDRVVQAHLKGLGHMERFEYPEAVAEFRRVRELAPGWIPGAINLAIALLNRTGEQEESSPAAAPSAGNYDEALALLDEVIQRDPENPHAHYCRGIILQQLGYIAEAHHEFRKVTEIDPNDGHTWYWVGSTLTDPEQPDRLAGPNQAEELLEIYTKALECNPYLVSALNKLQLTYGWLRDRDKQRELLALFQELNPNRETVPPGTGEMAEVEYASMGRYAQVINPLSPGEAPAPPEHAPRFEGLVPLHIELPEGHRWVEEADFSGPLEVLGRARARFGAAVATFDADGDGRLDLFLASAVAGPDGVRDALLINQGDGRFRDATRELGLPEDRTSLGVAAGDFDADGWIDLYLTGVGDNRLFRNRGPEGFEDVTESAGVTGPPAVSLTARWLDLDQDGDLDLYVVNYTSLEHAEVAFTDQVPPGVPNAAFRNDGQPAPVPNTPPGGWAPVAVAHQGVEATEGLSIEFSPWNDEQGALTGGDAATTGLAALDLENDRDIDLVLTADNAKTTAILNDRLGRFHAVELDELTPDEPVSGLLVTDLDSDGQADLVALSARGRATAWVNRSRRTSDGVTFAFEPFPTDATAWRSAVVADLDLDGRLDMVGLPVLESAETVVWARNDSRRLASRPLALGPDEAEADRPIQALALAPLAGNGGLPDLLLLKDGEGPRLARNLGNANQWVALDLRGLWRVRPEFSRTNPHGLGTQLTLQAPGLDVSFEYTTPAASLAQSVGPIVLGLGEQVASPVLLRLRWPDGVMQCEFLNVPDVQELTVIENNRKTGSCPVLFTWNGERFVCIGDFLGGGGLGYLVAPGVYSQPDRDEAVAIGPDQLREVDGVYRLSVTEPMDEVAYLDQLTLEVIDRPSEVSVAPEERFAPGGNRPSGELVAWTTQIAPVRATDLNGNDVTETLRHFDRKTVNTFRRLSHWIGYAEEHGIVLDFGDLLAKYVPDDRLYLALAGWVEYPYSQTNYAASTAGVALQPPVLERLRDDGTWEVIESDPGYPAGLPRLTLLELTGKLDGPRCVLRLKTNMECYWDQAFLAVREPEPELRVTTLDVARAMLGYRGYTREVAPDGRPPLLYDYNYVDPAPLARLSGHLTRFGDVTPLLREDDDQFCMLGPGDEVRVEFDATPVPDLPEGWTRSYVLRAVGYCKDADPFTATSDTIDPLPWKGMPDFPFGPEGERPDDPDYRAYLREYQTRTAGRP